MGYHHFPNEWPKARESLIFNFPPLWNESEKEQAEKNGLNIDNMIKLVDARMMPEERAIEELALKKAFSIKRTDEDKQLLASERDELSLLGPQNGNGNGVDADKKIEQLRNLKVWQGANFENANLIEAHPDDSIATVLRNAIASEIDAINLYEKMAAQTSDDGIRKLLLDIAKEEKTHIGEFEALLVEIDRQQEEELESGAREEEKIENIIRLSQLPEPTEAQIKAGDYLKNGDQAKPYGKIE